MSVKLEPVITGPGRYPSRDGGVAIVDRMLSKDSVASSFGFVAEGTASNGSRFSWTASGMTYPKSGPCDFDIIGPRIADAPQPGAEPLTEAELGAWSELAEKATAGPWEQWVEHGRVFRGPLKENIPAWITGGGREVANCETDAQGEEDSQAIRDAAFIAAAREAMPRLIAEIRRLRQGASE